ncbi:prolipoprotein diacylglyceryl transferase [Oscillibacter hominis]|uniref:Phosphatidylglycerol--prolipoprotein diacylglyceryl transferase n=1 Tax=Oscillibacter hominis TaxID=2763056 RepID=A0A7G9B150_9FIRM|nr:prolipoprotein diacylglyceryl transferase [Oscillibacter hominis]QNL43281.1 prolipoprotein diacylglyceryl transferase [Oscillibacter hominis]
MTALKDMPISFPGLFGDWEFTASPKMLNIGHGVYWYGFLIALGLMVALWFCMKQSKRFGITEDNVLDLVLWGTPAGILGARLYYVIFYWSLFQNADGSPNWGKIVAIWDGGLAIYGTVIAAFLTAFFYCRHKKIKLWAMTDLCVMGLLIGQAIGRWGNFMNREAFGAETTLPWRMRLWTSAAQYIEVHPTFFYESLWNVVGLLLIFFVVTKARRFDGENTCFYFLWYGLGRLWIEGLRTDSLYLFDWTLFGEPIRVSQALSLVVAILAALLLFYHIKLHPHDPQELMVNRVAAQKAEAVMEPAADAAEPEKESHASGEEDSDGGLH